MPGSQPRASCARHMRCAAYLNTHSPHGCPPTHTPRALGSPLLAHPTRCIAARLLHHCRNPPLCVPPGFQLCAVHLRGVVRRVRAHRRLAPSKESLPPLEAETSSQVDRVCADLTLLRDMAIQSSDATVTHLQQILRAKVRRRIARERGPCPPRFGPAALQGKLILLTLRPFRSRCASYSRTWTAWPKGCCNTPA